MDVYSLDEPSLSLSSSVIFDPIRKKWVKATPEERVRQLLLRQLIQGGFPKGLIAVEKSLEKLRRDSPYKRLKRRVDILCFVFQRERTSPLLPLLLIECKKGEADTAALEQVRGYNHHIKAQFIAVAGEKNFLLSSWDCAKMWAFLPTFEELYESGKGSAL
jgi:hypothetical protein